MTENYDKQIHVHVNMTGHVSLFAAYWIVFSNPEIFKCGSPC